VAGRTKAIKRVALTFDVEPPKDIDGISFDGSLILDELEERGIHATFFIQGAWARDYPEVARRIVAEGHTIGNHTFAHTRMADVSEVEGAKAVLEGERAIIEATGQSPRPYFRCPQNAGGWDKDTHRLLKSLGYHHIHWNAESWDWHEKASLEHTKQSLRDALDEYDPTVILLHSWSEIANEHLGEIIDDIANGREVEFVTIDALERDRAKIEPMVYESVVEPGAGPIEIAEPSGARKLDRSIAWGTIAKVVSVMANFIFGILLARSLGPAGKGQYAFIQQFVGILVVVLNLGLPTSNVYFVAKGKISTQTAITNSLCLLFPVTFLAAVVTGAFLFSPLRGELSFSIPLLTVALLLFVTSTLFAWFNAVLIGQHGLRPQAFATIASSVILLGATASLAMLGRVSVLNLLFVAVSGQAVGVIVLWWYDRSIKLRLKFDFPALRSMVRYSFQAYAIDVANFLHMRQDILLLGWLSTQIDVGIYSVSISFVEILRYMPIIIGSAFFAAISGEDGGHQEALTALLSRLNVVLNIILCIGFAVLLPIAIPLLFGKAFVPAVAVAFLLLPGAIMTSISEIPASFLFARENMYWKLASAMVVLNMGINIFVIPRYGAAGAAIASSITYSCYSLWILYLAKKETKLSFGAMIIPRASDLVLLKNKGLSIMRRGR